MPICGLVVEPPSTLFVGEAGCALAEAAAAAAARCAICSARAVQTLGGGFDGLLGRTDVTASFSKSVADVPLLLVAEAGGASALSGRVKITDELGVRFRLEVEGEFDSVVDACVFPFDVVVDSGRPDCDIGVTEEPARLALSA